jgi:hypothetical protein
MRHMAVVVRGESAEEGGSHLCGWAMGNPWKGRVTFHAGPTLHAISPSYCSPCCPSLGGLFDEGLHLLLVNAVDVDSFPEPCNNE